MLDTSLKKKRAVGIVLLAIILALFLAFNRLPKLDTVQEDLDAVTAPQVECFQGFCVENEPEKSFLSRWWDFSITYLRLVAIGMVFAFLIAGLTEAFLFPPENATSKSKSGIFKGTLKGLAIGPVWNLCSACVVPVATAFHRRLGLGGTVAMVQGSATLNIPALVMVALVFTPMLGGSRIVLSILGVLIIGPLVAMVVGRNQDTSDAGKALATPGEETLPWSEVLRRGLKDWAKSSLRYFVRLGPLMVVAGFISGLVMQWINPEIITTYLGNNVQGVVIAATFGILINVPLLFEIPLVALLLLLGMGTAPAAALLFTAAAGGPITFWGLARIVPKRGVATFAMATWAVGMIGGVGFLGLGLLTPDSNRGLSASVASTRIERSVSKMSTREILRSSDLWIPPVTANGSQPDSDPVTPFTNIASDALVNISEYWNNYVWNYRPGVAVFDYDRDGDLDFFISSESGHSNFLYRNENDGTFVDVAEVAGVASPESYSTGAIACDINNDGYQDLYVGAQGMTGTRLDFRSALDDTEEARDLKEAIKDRLYLNNADGTFTEITDTAFGDAVNLRAATSVACADVDGDGWLDLYVANLISEDFFVFDHPTHSGHYNVLYRNNGDLTFDNIASSAGVQGPQILMRDPQGRAVMFTDPETGREYEGYDPMALDANGNRIGDPTGRTHGVLFFDYDSDGDPDLWVASDGDRLRVYRNDSSPGEVVFTPVGREMGVDKVGNWMGLAVGDYDGDADLDVFVTNVGYHTRTRPPLDEPAGYCEYHDQFAWGTCLHSLLRNDGQRQVTDIGVVGDFKDVAPSIYVAPSPYMPPDSLEPKNIGPWWEIPTGLAAYDFGYGVTFFDLENDGDQDLYWLGSEVASGQGVGGNIYPGAGRMLRGDGQGSFEDITVRSRLLDILGVDYSSLDPDDPATQLKLRELRVGFHENGKGLAHGDLNGDGYVDLIGTNSSGRVRVSGSGSEFVYARGPIFVWLNGGGSHRWITLRLIGRMAIDGTGSNADGIGARVYLNTTSGSNGEPLTQVQEVRAGSSYLSMDSIDLEFGVGTAAVVDEITIFWPSGRKQVIRDVSVDQVVEIVEPEN